MLGASINAAHHNSKHSLATDLIGVIFFGLIPAAAGIWLGIKGFKDRQTPAGMQENAPAQPLLPGRPAGPRVAAVACGIPLVLGSLFMLLGALLAAHDSKPSFDDPEILYWVLQEMVLTPLLLGSYFCANGFRSRSSPGASVVERLLAGATALMLFLAGGQNLYFTARNLRDGRMVSVDFIVGLLSLAAVGGAVILARISLGRDDTKETPYQIASS